MPGETGMKKFLLSLLTWWNSQTLGTQIFTWRKGVRVGEDEQGNIYYQTRDAKRRWVIFNGECEATRVTPDWHGWLRYTFDLPPTEAPLPRRAWEKDHLPNFTGTPMAWRPQGSLAAEAKRPAATGDYQAWTPE